MRSKRNSPNPTRRPILDLLQAAVGAARAARAARAAAARRGAAAHRITCVKYNVMASAEPLTDGIKYIKGDSSYPDIDKYFERNTVEIEYFDGKDDVEICKFKNPLRLSTLLEFRDSILVKVFDGNVVGALQFSIVADGRAPLRLYVDWLCSIQKGVGAELLELIKTCIRTIQPNDLKLIILLPDPENPTLIEYYKKRGFKEAVPSSYLTWETSEKPAAGAGTAGGRRRRKSRKSRKSRRRRTLRK